MRPFKRALTSVCVWLGVPSFLNSLALWVNPPQPILATIAVRRPASRY